MTDGAVQSEHEHPPALQEAIVALSRWCLERLVEEEAKDRLQAPLYHYTNAAGLKGRSGGLPQRYPWAQFESLIADVSSESRAGVA